MRDPIWILRVRPLRVLLVCALLLLLLVLAARAVLVRWGGWLIETDPKATADVAVVLGGGEGERLGAALRIWREGRVGGILITGPDQTMIPVYSGEDSLTQGEAKRRIALRRGVPDDRAWLALGPTSTYEEAVRVREMLEERGVRRAIIVTSPFHSRRARRTFLQLFRGSGIELALETLPLEWSQDDPHRWWTREHDLLAVLSETVKLGFYWRTYGIRPF